ncbi:MAG: HAMP domain-containing histidine kinase [Alphaproteobacteria bacterium]|jgi:signal transduction histidine kinase|nr:HAMP domain-containing histidine kinase [Alphaproteobacteria bacterium]MBT4710066.1 HAMP domain-containing histidine kinase [Alphaproteobacteria bacterium]
MIPTRSHLDPRLLITSAVVVAGLVFFVDLSLPLGVAGGVPYVALVMVGWWFPQKRAVLVLAAIATGLIVAGYLLSPPGGVAWVVVMNRMLAGFAVWAAATLVTVVRVSQERNAAESANVAKSKFLLSMSHELRTPLNAILGFGQMLQAGVYQPLSKPQDEAIEHILDSGTHLMGLINGLLDLAQIESGTHDLEVSDVDPGQVIHECAVVAEALADRGSVTFHDNVGAGSLPVISVDKVALKQALLNLLSNAVKYNQSGGSVSLSTLETQDLSLRITVKDSGQGIPEDLQSQVFEPFQRLGQENSDFEGTGMGLTLTKRMVEDMGGRIGFHSAMGKGSEFWLDFPIISDPQVSGNLSGGADGPSPAAN